MDGAKIRIGISRCLLGEKVRYDGGHKLDHCLVETLGSYVEWVPVCPEVEYGLPVPREAMQLVGDPDAPRLVTIHSGIDHTAGMLKWARKKLDLLERDNLRGFIFKGKSPSSGYKGVRVFSSSGLPVGEGMGIFAAAFVKHFPRLPVEDDTSLHTPVLLEKFIERIFSSMTVTYE